MCGVSAVFGSPKGDLPLVVETMNRALRHRGPDGAECWVSDNKKVCLGHCHLAIMDEESGQQPLLSEDGQVAITVNGEFYDFKDIKESLAQKGYRFKTQSDSEILLALYQEYGDDCVHYLKGEFAFVLYDQRRNRLLAARDRFGVKPLCFYLDQMQQLYLASEAKALLAAGVEREWDLDGLQECYDWQYVPNGRTLFKDIQSVLPGHLLIYDGHHIDQRSYWDLKISDPDLNTTVLSPEKNEQKLESLLLSAVEKRLCTREKPVALHLSGGLDSSLIAAMAVRFRGSGLTAFTVEFDDPLYDEASSAQQVADYLGFKLEKVPVTVDTVIEFLSDAVCGAEGLAINSHLVAKYALNKAIAKADFKVVMTGEGADELMGGYAHLRQDCFGTVQSRVENDIISGVQFAAQPKRNLDVLEQKFGYVPSFVAAKSNLGCILNDFLTTEFKARQAERDTFDSWLQMPTEKAENTHFVLRNSTYLWTKSALAKYILRTLGDGCEMPHGLEGRVPFLDQDLWAYAQTLPLEAKLNGSIEKYLLRAVAKKYLPSAIALKPKKTFMAPPLLLNNNRGRAFLADHINSQDFESLNFFNQAKLLKKLHKIKELTLAEKIALEPVFMMVITTYFIQKNYKLIDGN